MRDQVFKQTEYWVMPDWMLLILGGAVSVLSTLMVCMGFVLLQRFNIFRRQVQKQVRQLARATADRQQAQIALERQLAQLQVKVLETAQGLDQCLSDKSSVRAPQHQQPGNYRRVAAVLARGQADAQTIQSMGYSRSEAHLLNRLARSDVASQ